MPRIILLFALLAGPSGCLFEPECDTYEACITSPEPGTGADAANAGRPDGSNVNGSSPDAGEPDGSTIVNNGTCLIDTCPDSDIYTIAGSRRFPAICDSADDTRFLAFEETASVCSGRPRNYEAWISPCPSSTYILDIEVTPTNGCVRLGEVDVDFGDRRCGDPDVRCAIDGQTIVRSFIVRESGFDSTNLFVSVDASRGGFDYAIVIETRR